MCDACKSEATAAIYIAKENGSMVECTAFTVICRCHKPGNAESVQNHNQFHKSCIIKKPTVALFHLKNS